MTKISEHLFSLLQDMQMHQRPLVPNVLQHTALRQLKVLLSGVLVCGLLACGGGANTNTPPLARTSTKLPHTGITASQCYQAGSNVLVTCDSAGAIALSGTDKQDGMLASVNAMSYSAVGSYSREDCVKDNVTGLMWEGKTANGPRAGSNRYTNYDSTSSPQKWNGSAYVNPTQSEVDASTNSVVYVAYVNSIALCGYTDWRLPTVDELQTLVDYGVTFPGPTINTTWFPNTDGSSYWSSSPGAGNYSGGAWGVDFYDGSVDAYVRNGAGTRVRLVRASQ